MCNNCAYSLELGYLAGPNAFMAACRYGHIELVKLLLVRCLMEGQMLNTVESTELITILIEYGIDVNVCNHAGDTPLMIVTRAWAKKYNKHYNPPISNIINRLLEYGADVTIKNRQSLTIVNILQIQLCNEQITEIIALFNQFKESNCREYIVTKPLFK